VTERNQQVIPGTERDDIPQLTKAAEKYRKLVTKRMDFGKKEAEAKAELQTLIHALIDEKEIELPDTATAQIHTVYRYEDEDGQVRDVKFGSKETVKVNLASEDAE